MSIYNGMRIVMISVGDADAILVMNWANNVQTNVLIDSGTKSDFPKVKGVLREFGISVLHHVVNSHPHGDHQGGLIELAKDTDITIGKAWMHLPWNYLDFQRLDQAISQAGARKRAKQLREAFESTIDLHDLFTKRKTPLAEPFTGQRIGPFTVVGPTPEFYSDRLHEFDELSEIIAEDEWRKQQDEQELHAEIAEYLGQEATISKTLETNPVTEPENNTSTILMAQVDGKTIVLTADAGAPALLAAASCAPLANCEFMQIPHHGSRHNISPFLVQHFRPKMAFVSAVGNKKHPRVAVVNAFKAAGAQVYSTHYPKALNLFMSYGTTPPCPWTGKAVSLWDAGA